MPRHRQSKHWCFTINNATEEDGRLLHEARDKFTYIVIGKEIGEEEKTPHMQGYVVFKKTQRLTAVSRIMPRAFLRIKYKKSSPLAAATYCKKDGDWMERGELPLTAVEGTKERWSLANKAAVEGRFEDIPPDMLCRYYHSYKRMQQDNPVKPDDLNCKHNYWIWAPTQYGKSNYARRRWPDYFDKAPNKWFIGYKGQTTILLDDFGPEQCHYLGWYMKRWADLYSFPMESKGGGRQIRPKHIVLTSQYTIAECFEDERVMNAMHERFIVIHLTHWKTRINCEQVL